MQKKNYNFVLYTAAISFIIFALLQVVLSWSFNESFYKVEHSLIRLNNQSVSEYIGISDEELEELTSFTLDYLKNSNATLDKQMIIKGKLREVFTDDEKAHMVDVKKLCFTSRYICILSLVIYLICMFVVVKNKLYNELLLTQIKVYKVFGIFLLFLILWIVIDFNSFWNFFHHIFFAGNDLWLLDLNKDILIMIVPPEFFFYLVGIIVICFIILLVVYLIVLKFLKEGILRLI